MKEKWCYLLLTLEDPEWMDIDCKHVSGKIKIICGKKIVIKENKNQSKDKLLQQILFWVFNKNTQVSKCIS